MNKSKLMIRTADLLGVAYVLAALIADVRVNELGCANARRSAVRDIEFIAMVAKI